MHTLRRAFVLSAVALFASTAQAQNIAPSHLAAAASFHDLSKYSDQLQELGPAIDQMMLELKAAPDLRPEFEKLIHEVFLSPEFRDGKIKGYASAFSEQELDLLIQLASHPAYQLYVRRLPTLRAVSNQAVVEAFSAKQADILKRYSHLFKRLEELSVPRD